MNRYASRLLVTAMTATPTMFAQQQETVKIGGQIKLGMDNLVSKSSSRASQSVSRLHNNTSFWYLDSKEDLGAGLNAYFRLEWDFAADTGNWGAGRNFFVGLGHQNWGRLQLGRQSVYFSHHWPLADAHGSFDTAPNAANSLNVLGSINGAYFSGGFLNNTVRYVAPSIAGFSGMASYSFDAESADSSRNGTFYLNPTYTNDTFKLGFYHMTRRAQGSLPGQTVGTLDQSANRIAAGYTAKGWQLGLIIDRNKVTNDSTHASEYRLAYAIPVSYSVGPHKVSGTWGQALDTHANGNKLDNSGAQMLSISYQYALSKRTLLGVSFVELRNQRNGRYGFWLGGLSGMQLPVADAGGRNRMLYTGIKHVF